MRVQVNPVFANPVMSTLGDCGNCTLEEYTDGTWRIVSADRDEKDACFTCATFRRWMEIQRATP